MPSQWFKDYLSFHRAERNGIIAFIIFFIALIAFNTYQRVFWEESWAEFQLQYGLMVTQFHEIADSIAQSKGISEPWVPKTKELFQFDPNTLDSTGWVALGFSPKQSAAILKYRTAGVTFRKPEDIKKLFVVDDKRYEALKPFIAIAPVPETELKKSFTERPTWKKPEYEPVSVELNTVDSATLVKIKGIGPFFARVIIEHREKLGGYRSKEQVLEVYGMDSAKYAAIEEHLTVNTDHCTDINIKTATLKELVRHPYITFKHAKAIVNYREQHGAYRQLADLQKIHLIDEETYAKMYDYLHVD